ncbi:membrane protein [Lysobacter enzymogenes]|uniref:Membrane protein n=1 Tax=Lysobacter enzymogenes TaxID=69 RepID=A0A0S2DC02_LYSEN|nr:hypothetical protein [Lysobacter enzymogenes]ALN56017.1 membrane protein [Lysobacter enzymogenes]QCW24956.1 hypothetical protein FE772_03990 [Lysobacter enzymogenes]
MRLPVLIAAALMPAVAWFSQQGYFGPDNGEISDRYPTLLVAAGYAFAIWGPIFLLDLIFAVFQLRARWREDDTLLRVRPAAAAGFMLTALWMPLFSQQWFWLALATIWLALACLAWTAAVLARDPTPLPGQALWAGFAIGLHAGWLSLAAFLNTAQVIVAYRLAPVDAMLPWSLGLFAAAALVLLAANARMRGSAGYVLAALWGLAGVYAKQSESALPGAATAAWVAVGIGGVLLAQTAWLRLHPKHRVFSGHLSPGE